MADDAEQECNEPVCPKCGGERMGIELPMVYDGILFWQCDAGCGHRWHRFPVGHPLRLRANAHIRNTTGQIGDEGSGGVSTTS